MSLRLLGFVGVYFTGLLLTFYHPIYGVLTYFFEWHNHPPFFWWGDPLPDLRWSLTISLATLISWGLKKNSLPKLVNPDFSIFLWLVPMVVLIFLVSFFSAINPDESLRKADFWMKIVIYYFIIINLVRENKHYKMLIWVILLGIANFGLTAWEVGSNRDIGVMAPNATEENAISIHVMTMMPFFGIYFIKGKKWEKIASILAVPFAINLIILANSRSSFVGLLAMAVLAFFWSKGRLRLWVLAGIIAGAVLFYSLANEQFWDRQAPTEEYGTDGSAVGRLYLWESAWEIMLDYPFGVGGKGYNYIVADYAALELKEIMSLERRSVHNTFLSVGTSWGFLGLFLYLGFIFHSFKIMSEVKKRAYRIPALRHYYYDGMALQIAFVGLMVAGIFHTRQYAEIVFWLSAFGVILKNLQNMELEKLRNSSNEETDKLLEEKSINNVSNVKDNKETKQGFI